MMDNKEIIDVIEDNDEETTLSEFDLDHDDNKDYDDPDSDNSSELSVDLTLVKEEILDNIPDDDDDVDDNMEQIPQEAHDLLKSSSNPENKGSLKNDGGITSSGDYSECPNCQKSIKTTYMKRHIRLIHGSCGGDSVSGVKANTAEKRYSCKICGKRFYSHAHMAGHIYSHTRSMIHECRWKCGATFTSYWGRVRHERITHYDDNPVPSECDICGRPCKDDQLLRLHRITHMTPEERKQFRCSICYIPFDSVEVREKHEERHRNEKKFECPVCKKLFKNSRNLRDHRKRDHPYILYNKKKAPQKHPCHSTNYKCPREECGKCFEEKDQFETHMEAHHRLHECHICGKKFQVKQEADIHLLSFHKLGKEDLKKLGRWQPRILVDKLPLYMLRRWHKNVKILKKSSKNNSSGTLSSSNDKSNDKTEYIIVE